MCQCSAEGGNKYLVRTGERQAGRHFGEDHFTACPMSLMVRVKTKEFIYRFFKKKLQAASRSLMLLTFAVSEAQDPSKTHKARSRD